MPRQSIRRIRPLLACAAAAAIWCAATRAEAKLAQDGKDMREEPTPGPSTLAISFPWQWLAASGGTMKFECEANKPANDDGVKMIEALSRKARHGHYAGTGDDGGTFTGDRKGDDFTFEAVGKDGSRFSLQMPWSAARCIFGGAKEAGASGIELRARDLGGRLRLEIAGEKKGVRVDVK